MTQRRPFGVTILAILAGLAALATIYHTLQFLGLLPVTIAGPFGEFKFFTVDWLGALMWGLLALIYLWVLRKLWAVAVQGWLFVTALSAINLIFAVISILGESTWQAMLPSLVINGLILIYCLLPGTKSAFQVEEMQQAAAASRAAPATATSEPESMVETAVPASMEPEPIASPEPDYPAPSPEPESPDPEDEDIEETGGTPAPTTSEIIDDAVHQSPGEEAKFSAHADFIKGIGPAYSEKLKAVGIESPQTMLEACATRQGREEVEKKTGISHKLILKWTHEAEFYRIKGIGQKYAYLLDAAGVGTILELAQRNPENLHEAIVALNQEKQLVHEVPSLNLVTDWINQAKELPRVVSY